MSRRERLRGRPRRQRGSGRARHRTGSPGFGRRGAGWRDHPARAVERAAAQLQAEQAIALERAGQRQLGGRRPARSRSGRNRARRRAGSRRHGRVAWQQSTRGPSARRRCRACGNDRSTASGPSISAGTPPALTCHNRTVPTNFPWRTADRARPSAGARPSRSRWQVRIPRLAPKQASSSASRATTSATRSARIANGTAFGVKPTGVFGKAVMARPSSLPGGVIRQRRCQSFGCRGWEPAHRLPVGQASRASVRCGRSAAAECR